MPPMLGAFSHRRTFVARLAAGLAAAGTAIVAGSAPAFAEPSPKDFRAARHPQDDWMDGLPGKHRLFLDAISPQGAAEAISFASNFALANKNGYGLEAADLAILIGYRHFATPFAFNDSVWAKYGTFWGGVINFKDPATGAAPQRNAWNTKGLPGMQPNRGVTVEEAAARGYQFAVCDLATRVFSDFTAKGVGGKADEIYAELRASALPNTHFVPAGIVAVGRAQERGYAFSYVG
ncbi:MAG TPA: hypothetical protein VGJ96_08880 [Gemmatimonadaceae bacterium]